MFWRRIQTAAQKGPALRVVLFLAAAGIAYLREVGWVLTFWNWLTGLSG